MKNLSFFPGINKRKAIEVFSIDDPEFLYTRDGEKRPLYIRDEGSTYELRDEEGLWNADEYDLILRLHVTCKDADRLYGYDPYDMDDLSCACNDAVIGLALAWSSRDSRQRATVEIGTIDNFRDEQDLKIEYVYPKGSLRGGVSFSLILYVKEEGNPTEDEKLFANTQGAILGEIENFNIVIDGNGSYFTICEVNKPGGILWSVEYEMDDPSSDVFSDCVSINLNRAHESYRFIDRKSPDFNLQLFLEIIAGSLIAVIETVRSQDESFNCLGDPEEGSVAQALLYFRDVLEWDFSTPLTLSSSVRKFFEKNNSSL